MKENKNLLHKASTLGVVLTVAVLVSLSGNFGSFAESLANGTSGYGYGKGVEVYVPGETGTTPDAEETDSDDEKKDKNDSSNSTGGSSSDSNTDNSSDTDNSDNTDSTTNDSKLSTLEKETLKDKLGLSENELNNLVNLIENEKTTEANDLIEYYKNRKAKTDTETTTDSDNVNNANTGDVNKYPSILPQTGA